MGLTAFRASNLFAVLAIGAYYYFSGPTFLNTLGQVSGLSVPPIAVDLSRGLGVVLGALVLFQGWRNERVYLEAQTASEGLRVDESQKSLKDRLSNLMTAQVTEMSSGSSFPVAPGQTLLEAMETAGVKINFGCRSGLCGADAVAVCEGGDHLSPPDDDELATLRRLGLEGKARLACMCQVKGPVTIDVDPHSAGAQTAAKNCRTGVDGGSGGGKRRRKGRHHRQWRRRSWRGRGAARRQRLGRNSGGDR